MLLECEIHFDVLREGYVASASVNTLLDATEDLFPQARAEVMDWIDRKARIHGYRYELMGIRAVQFQFNGKWHSELEWTPDVLQVVESRATVPARPITEGHQG